MKRTDPAALKGRSAISAFAFFWVLLIPAPGVSQMTSGIAECAKIEDDAERLRCYDHLAGRESAAEGTKGEPSPKREEKQPQEASYFSRLWELDKETRRGPYSIAPYRSNYILPFTYNASPNSDAV
jgi:phospholipase A1